MKRRTPINVWPALTDLMIVLAVVSLFVVLRLLETKDSFLRRELAYKTQIEVMEKELREKARNRQMFLAIQKAQKLIDEFTEGDRDAFEDDQSLQFGDDLVSYPINGVEPEWLADSREKLHDFCSELTAELSREEENIDDLRQIFTIQVEGHTDSTTCPGDPHCNWWISSARAAVFVSLMKNDEICPGGRTWNLVPMGFADTRPPQSDGLTAEPTRRIAVRIVPNYSALIKKVEGDLEN